MIIVNNGELVYDFHFFDAKRIMQVSTVSSASASPAIAFTFTPASQAITVSGVNVTANFSSAAQTTSTDGPSGV